MVPQLGITAGYEYVYDVAIMTAFICSGIDCPITVMVKQ